MCGLQSQDVEQDSKEIVYVRKHKTNRKDPKMQVFLKNVKAHTILSTNLLIVPWEAVVDLFANFLTVSSAGKWVFNTVGESYRRFSCLKQENTSSGRYFPRGYKRTIASTLGIDTHMEWNKVI